MAAPMAGPRLALSGPVWPCLASSGCQMGCAWRAGLATLPHMVVLARLALLMALCGSLALTLLTVQQLLANPALRPVAERSLAEIRARTDRLMAEQATPERLEALVTARLAETPRNWVALEALAEVTAERGLALPPAYEAAWQDDSGLMAATAACLSCMWDSAACDLETGLICKAPVLLTPAEDIRGVVKAGVDYSLGQPVDRLDLGLSVVGLAATAAVVPSGGLSSGVKTGVATLKLARGMGRLSPALTGLVTDALTDAIRWSDLPALRSASELPAVLRSDALRPLAATLEDLAQVAADLGPARALHVLPLVDDAADARRLALAARALGPQTIGRAEVLGKSGLLRATVRLTDTALALMTGLIGLLLSAALLLAGVVQAAVQRLVLRGLKRRIVT